MSPKEFGHICTLWKTIAAAVVLVVLIPTWPNVERRRPTTLLATAVLAAGRGGCSGRFRTFLTFFNRVYFTVFF